MKNKELSQKEKYIRKVISWGMQALVFLVIVYLINLWQTRNLIPSDERAPNFKIISLKDASSSENQPNKNELAVENEKSFQLNHLKGKKSIIFFFAPWCKVCKANFSFIDSLYSSSNQDYNIIAISLSYDSPEEVKQYVKEGGYKMPVFLGNDEMMSRYKIGAFPSIYILNSDLTVSSKMTGFSTNWGIRFRLLLAH